MKLFSSIFGESGADENVPIQVVTSMTIHAGNLELQDRADIFSFQNRTVIALADGAGGRSGGAEAAEHFLKVVRGVAGSLNSPESCRKTLVTIDHELASRPECGETTGIIVIVQSNTIYGASVGDSMAWLFEAEKRAELTSSQQRKPFLGDGIALVQPFSVPASQGTLIVASDGLWKYSAIDAIDKRVREIDSGSLANDLADLVRLRSGTFPDDVAIVTCRCAPRPNVE